MAEKEDFYQELDSRKRSFCTCQTLVIGLVAIIVLLVLATIVIWRKITTATKPARTVSVTNQDATNVAQRFNELSKAPGASTTLTLNEGELSSLFVEAIAKNPKIPLRNVQATIEPTFINLSGKLTEPITSDISINLIPSVVDGKPNLELTKVQAGSLTVPKQVTELLANNLRGLLVDQLGKLQNITIKSIVLGKGKMTISGINATN